MPLRRSDRTTPRVAVIGAGPGGLCMGVGLRRLEVAEFTIFEQSTGLGGTWHDNTYPGAAVDIPVPFYSFSFHSYDFSRTHPTQPELVDYLQSVADCYQLGWHMRFGTAVERVVWDEATHTYDVFTSDGVIQQFDVVVSAVGLLNHPKYPTWPGLDTFAGPKFHSARWDPSVELRGKRVAVVGTGSSGAQIVPAIAPDAAHVYVFQRQPGWVVAKGDRDFTAAERARMLGRGYRQWLRIRQLMLYERSGRKFYEGTRQNVAAQRACEEYIGSVFKDRPDLAKLVTPDYPFGGKRPVTDSNYYPALLQPNVELIPHEVVEVRPTAVVDDTGEPHEVDVLVMCTGFQASNFLATVEIVGRDGRTIHDVWAGEPRAYLGLTVAGFPNFYMLYGPNTNGAPIMFMHERQVEFVTANLKRMITRGVTSIEVRGFVLERFDRMVQKRLSTTVVSTYPDIHHYGRVASGRDVISWRDGMLLYSLLARTTARLSSTARRRTRPAVSLRVGQETSST